jgi:hypothetical protein|tara:strand:+ start:164 stop:343 length:180 start_codon:yes stop_codon:yes gene_type:complete
MREVETMEGKKLTLKEIRQGIKWSRIYGNPALTASLKRLAKEQQIINDGWINETIKEEG